MSRAYENFDRLHNVVSDFKIDKLQDNLTSQQQQPAINKFIYRKDGGNSKYHKNADCDNRDETNLFYSFQMEVEECEQRENANKYPTAPTTHDDKTADKPVDPLLITQLPCGKCDKTFPSKQSLRAHIRIFHSESSVVKNSDGFVQHECEYCHKLFSQATGLSEHRRIHTGEKPYQCKVCPKTFSRSIYLCVHMRSHTGEKPYSCKTCNKAFTQKKSLSSHTRIHTGEKPFGCTECDKAFARSYYLRIHMRSHTGEKPFTCDLCDKSFSQKQSLSVHLKTHSGEKVSRKRRSKNKNAELILPEEKDPLADDTCYTPNGTILPDSPDESESARHILPEGRVLPPPLKELQPPPIDLKVSAKELSDARNRISNEKQMYPDPRDFTTISRHFLPDFFPRHHLLELHDSSNPQNVPGITDDLPILPRLQPNGKPHEYLCKDCNEGFPNMRDLTLHERTHTGLYKYRCGMCSKAFRKSYNLRLHMRSHTGEKPYQCTQCGKYFSQSSSLLVHTKTHLREKESNGTV